MAMRRNSVQRIANAVLLAGAAVILSVPIAQLGTHAWVKEQENRLPTAWPPAPDGFAAALTWPAGFEAYFNDHFGWRASLVSLRTNIDLRLFNILPVPILMIGRKNWVFLISDYSIADFMGLHRVSDDGIAAWWNALKDRHDKLAAVGIRYVFLVAPNKQSIYPELMPRGVVQGAETDLDRLLAFAAANGHPDWLIDVRPALRAAKGGLNLYHPVDMHWNDFGAYIAYRELARALASAGVSMRSVDVPRRDFAVTDHARQDLIYLMGLMASPHRLKSAVYAGHSLACRGQDGKKQTGPRVEDVEFLWHEMASACDDAPAGSTALVLHDSMMIALAPYVAASFAHVVYVPWQPDTLQILDRAESAHAEVVIDEIIERNLIRVPRNPGLLATDRAAPATHGGSVQMLTNNTDGLTFDGWALWQPQEGHATLSYKTNIPVTQAEIGVHQRLDIVAALHDDRLEQSGFTLRLALKPGMPMPAHPSICVWSDDRLYGARQLNFVAPPGWTTCP